MAESPDSFSSVEPFSPPQTDVDSTVPTASARAKLNQKVFQSLRKALDKDPEVDLLSLIPSDYRYFLLGKAAVAKPIPQNPQEPTKPRPGQPDLRSKLAFSAKSASIIHPLSDSTLSMLSLYLDSNSSIQDPLQDLVPVLKRMIAESEVIWEHHFRGFVLKCTEDLAVKIVKGNDLSNTEYAALTYLEQHAPDLPVPKPHGFIKLDNFSVIFMTLFKSTALQKVWSLLGHENKVKIQGQLDTIFARLRQLEKASSASLESDAGDSISMGRLLLPVVDEYGEPVRQPGDRSFSVSRLASTSWIQFLQGFLPIASNKRVFTHGDLWLANIMVELDHNGDYAVSGVIDWENGGFYPEHFEASRILAAFNLRSESDWFKYLPDSIAPKNYPIHWLIHRLWQATVEFS